MAASRHSNLVNLAAMGLLACPACHEPIAFAGARLACRECGQTYRIENDIPLFVRDRPDDSQGPPERDRGAQGEVFERIPIGDIAHDDPCTILDLQRYQFAAAFVAGRKVLDMACGTGYGTRMLVDDGKARVALGIDLSMAGLRIAVPRISEATLGFVCASACRLPLMHECVDACVSMETIEHIAEADQYLNELSRVLRPSGIAIISTPLNESEGRLRPTNPYHVREYSASEFAYSLGRHFSTVTLYSQVTIYGDAFFDVKMQATHSVVAGTRLAARMIVPAKLRGAVRKLLRMKGRIPLSSAIVEGVRDGAGVQLAICVK